MKKLIIILLFFVAPILADHIDFPVIRDNDDFILLKNRKNKRIPIGSISEIFMMSENKLVNSHPIAKATVIEVLPNALKVYVVFRESKINSGGIDEPFLIKDPKYFFGRVQVNSFSKSSEKTLSIKSKAPKEMIKNIKNIKTTPTYSFFMKKNKKNFAVWLILENDSALSLSPFKSIFINLFKENGYNKFSLKKNSANTEIIKISIDFRNRGKIKNMNLISASLVSTVYFIKNSKSQLIKKTKICISNGAGPSFNTASIAALERSKICLKKILN